ncbi:sulfotransferase [Lewinella sp. 4G2]|uniref:sulfotransferase n=1 Tax=Lewinella sp. 4G2 TaxID=1803372 RepID=UPI0007B4B33C|nr:sulfotransferase [Lewinella sp. 4G2]OAV46194.1 hypothetical protein A3850_018215 [Lewinella sp. 4G2]
MAKGTPTDRNKTAPRRSLPDRLNRLVKGRYARARTAALAPFVGHLVNTRPFSLDQSLTIFSPPRSGSNWLMESLHRAIPRTLINYEPFHFNNGVGLKEWGWNPAIAAGADDANSARIIQEALTLQRRSPWTMSYVRPGQLLRPEFVLTKMVRANQLLAFYLEQFEPKYKPILLLRHPVAATVSYLRSFRPTKDPADWSPPPLTPYNGAYHEHREFLQSGHSLLSFWTAIWCMRNHSVLRDASLAGRVIPVFYEDLLLRPEEELGRILEEWDLCENTQSRLKSTDIRKPSATDHRGDLLRDPQQQLRKHFHEVSDSDRARIEEVFQYFRIEVYSPEDPLPARNALFKPQSV